MNIAMYQVGDTINGNWVFVLREAIKKMTIHDVRWDCLGTSSTTQQIALRNNQTMGDDNGEGGDDGGGEEGGKVL
jgi:hypothetical protein